VKVRHAAVDAVRKALRLLRFELKREVNRDSGTTFRLVTDNLDPALPSNRIFDMVDVRIRR
jgi:hypothetical protein